MHNYVVLAIDDDAKANSVLKEYAKLTRECTIDCATSIHEAIKKIKTKRYDLITLDIELKGENGLEELSQIKSVYGGPIIFVSCLSDRITVANSFNSGADDYISKPYDFEELFLRIERSIQRHGKYRQIIIDEYRIDELKETVYYKDKLLELNALSQKILILLLKNANSILPRKYIFDEVWGSDYTYSSRVVDTHISSIRKATCDYRFKSVRGCGYTYRSK